MIRTTGMMVKNSVVKAETEEHLHPCNRLQGLNVKLDIVRFLARIYCLACQTAQHRLQMDVPIHNMPNL